MSHSRAAVAVYACFIFLHVSPPFAWPLVALNTTYLVSAVPVVNPAVTSCPNVFVNRLEANRMGIEVYHRYVLE